VIGSLRRPDEYTPHRAYWGEIIGAATLAAADRGYGVVVLPGLTGSAFDASALAALAVISAAPGEPDLDLALGLGIPVLTDVATTHPSAIVVDIPYAATVDVACSHLAERGALRPALLCADLDTNFSVTVIDAYHEWCRARSIAPLVIDASESTEVLARSVDRALDDGTDAIFTVDGCAPVVLEIAERRRLEMGRDLLLAELDDDTDGGCSQRRTTNISLALAEFAGEATLRMIDVAEKAASADAPLRCAFELTPRASTAGRR
jgi:DNA-binding LacI/PurR family transcriptional regulator